ncbi:hypothetical protein ANRL4_05339 [Anaerolineae bacterium]|nr:hypothetical protein ANRL4_05339 [Anaerolineae bacterium]
MIATDQSDSGLVRVPLREVALITAAALAVMMLLLQWLVPPYTGFTHLANHYADQFRAGNGLVFNAGERVLLVAAPVYLLLLAISPSSLPFVLGVALGMGCAYFLARQAVDSLTAFLVTAVYAGLLTIGINTPYPLAAGLCLLGVVLTLHQRPFWAGMIFALAVGVTPESLIPALITLLSASQRQSADRFALGLMIGLAALIAALIAYYGEGLRGLLTARTYLLPQMGLILTCAGLSIPALAGVLARMQFVIQKGLPLLALLATIIFGVVFLNRSSQPDPALPVERLGFGSASAAPFTEHPLNQMWIAFDGNYQPDIRAMTERGDHRSPLVKYLPQTILVDRAFDPAYFFGVETLERLGYRLSGDGRAWQFNRPEPSEGFSHRPFTFRFTPDVSLSAVSLDSPPEGGLQRVGLYWHLERSALRPIRVRFRAVWQGTESALFEDEIAASILRAGTVETYHALPLPAGVSGEDVQIYLSLIINDGHTGNETLIGGD